MTHLNCCLTQHFNVGSTFFYFYGIEKSGIFFSRLVVFWDHCPNSAFKNPPKLATAHMNTLNVCWGKINKYIIYFFRDQTAALRSECAKTFGFRLNQQHSKTITTENTFKLLLEALIKFCSGWPLPQTY